MQTDLLKYILFFLAAGVLIGSVSAGWYFEPNSYNLNNISNSSNAIFTTDLVENSTGEDLKPSDIANFTAGEGGDNSNTYVVYEYERYNQTSGSSEEVNETLSYSEDLDTWYAEFEPNYDNMSQLEFKARGESLVSGHENSEGEVNKTVTASVNEVRVDLLSNLDDPIKADKDVKIDVRAINITNDEALNDSQVNTTVYFHNKTVKDSELQYELDNYNDESLDDDGQYFFNSEVSTPEKTNASYIFRVEVDAANTSGSYSMFIDTAPAITGSIGSINSGGCNEIDVADECDPGSEIDTDFDITEATAENVNITLFIQNSSDSSWENHSMYSMDEISASSGAQQTFNTNLTLPDINTSDYNKKYRLHYHAWNQDREYRENHTIDLKSFIIEDRSSPTAFKSRDHTVTLFLGEEFSRDSFDKTRFNKLNTTVEGPDNNYSESFSIDDFTYSSDEGTMETTVVIPDDEQTGAYDLHVDATDFYGENKQITRGLSVQDVNATFSAQDEVDMDYSSTGVYYENITIESLVDSENTIGISLDHENLSIQEDITLSGNEESEVELEINVTGPGDIESEVEFSDSSAQYNETTDISIGGPVCQLRDGDLCSDVSEIDVETEESETITEMVGLTNLDDGEMNLTATFEGNASQRFSTDENITLEGYEEIEVEFDGTQSGHYEGELVIESNNSEEISLNLTGLANLSSSPESDPSLTSTPSSIEIGSIAEGESYSTDLTIRNDGDTEVNQITADTGGLNINIGEFDLSPDEEEVFELTISNPQTTTIEFTGQNSDETVTLQVPVNAEVIEDYSQRTDELRNRMNNLRSRTNDTQLESQLNEVSAMVDQIETQWDSGNYEEAQTTFQNAQETLDSVQQSISSQETNGGGTGGGGEQDPSESTGGGVPIIPILGVLFVLLLVGAVVFYESYIPEEGDPLYGVMGE